MSLSSHLGNDIRTRKINKNIVFSLGIKGIDAITQFLLVPVTLGFLNPYEYGIWLTLNSILLWINSFDIGLGNGFRNQMAIAIAQKDYELARSLVSTAFGMIMIIMLIVFIAGSIVVLNVNWYSILNASIETVPNLVKIVYVSFALFCANFMVKFVGNVYLAMQMPSINNLLVSLGHLLSLIIIFILTLTTNGSLYKVAFAFSLSPVVIYIIAYPITFNIVYTHLKPSFRLFSRKYFRPLFNIGMLFFLLQISGVILFAMSNIVISNLFGPEKVTPFNIAQRYFSIVNMLMAIILSPMWSAVTDAFANGEMNWISSNIKKTDRYIIMFAFIIIVMLIISKTVYVLWVGTNVDIPFMMSLLMGLYTLIIISSTGYSYFLNGMGKLRIQTITTLTVATLFFPVCYFAGQVFGVYGVLISMCLLNVFGAIFNRIQVQKLIRNKATGLWNK